ncbi:hypothetical protein O6H91_14G026400 [Diphasiastrum complanatum]|uniref:Uncharacterized protein n=2 Tax=Diphasiastrum complanatum TaxID=34168 RepID=A0ACC2BNJ0_DIPCM|nr:hypothetical protein O6H91_14G026400 [Diphasiastrum complanatum]
MTMMMMMNRREEVDSRLLRLCRALPKVELHAHLNGCVRPSTLLELAEECSRRGLLSLSDFQAAVIVKEDRSMEECFQLFGLIHLLTTDHCILTRITKEVIEDFAAENVVYLELRTTPKRNEAVGMTKRSYVEAVLAGIKAASTELSLDSYFDHKEDNIECPSQRYQRKANPQIHVRLLLSIDRRETLEAAMETVHLAWEMRDLGVVGVDLSGNPCIGDWETFLPALKWARQHGLPITLHCGEVPNPREVEAMLAFQPERVGHACFLESPDLSTLLANRIPVEICLTSNLLTNSVQRVRDHHFGALYNANHPVVLCTDDPGVFSISLSYEYALVSTHFGLSSLELLHLSRNAIEFTFAEDRLKQMLQSFFDGAKYAAECQCFQFSGVP